MSGSPFPATDVGHSRPRFQLLFHTAQSGNPCAHEIGGIAWAEELFASVKDAVHVLIPTHAGAGAEGFGDPWNRRQRAQSQFECSRQICRAVFRCQSERLLFTQAELLVFSS